MQHIDRLRDEYHILIWIELANLTTSSTKPRPLLFSKLQEPFTTILYDPARKKEPSSTFQKERDSCLEYFSTWNESDQVDFVEQLLSRMCHYQHGHINSYLRPMLQRDFISLLPSKLLYGGHLHESGFKCNEILNSKFPSSSPYRKRSRPHCRKYFIVFRRWITEVGRISLQGMVACYIWGNAVEEIDRKKSTNGHTVAWIGGTSWMDSVFI